MWRCPPSGKLPDEEIAVLTRWVKTGAPWSNREEYGVVPHSQADTRGDGRDYWAYQPITRPALPVPVNKSWGNNAIDAFVGARLQAAGLEPNPKADKIALVRRAYYDLTGLPPTPAQVDRFTADDSPNAFEQLVDQLLESPQYGERWGRHWLDLVRYAETHGYERDSPKPEAWRYRDYVIESLNKDKPYDQFVTEQLAGDELSEVTRETLTATGYYRLGLWDDEPVDRELARYDGLDDIVKTTSEVVLGTAMGCVRCHSHKADPIDHQEYYQFLAYFHDVADANRENVRRWVTDEDRLAHEQRVRERAQQESSLVEKIGALEAEFSRQLLAKRGIQVTADGSAAGDRFVFPDSREQPQQWEYTFQPPSDDWMQPDYSTTSWDRGPAGFGRDGTPGAVVRTSWMTTDIWLRKWFEIDDASARLAIELHHDNDCEIYLNGQLIHAAKGHTTKYERVVLDQRAVEALKVGRNVIALHCRQRAGGQYIDCALLHVTRQLDMTTALKEHGVEVLDTQGMKQLAGLRKQLTQLRKNKLPAVGTPIMSVSEQRRGPVHVLIRGNPHAKGDRVEPSVPSVLGTTAPVVHECTTNLGVSSGKRLALARWMFQPDNPLTARVIANRIWQYHFGRGIVSTPNDFGKLGQLPTHPELLDWLACEIRDGGWKLKRIHKLVLSSAAWQMSSQVDAQKYAADPENRWWWRFNMRRLGSEEVRDSMLAVTGELNLQPGGASVYAPIAQAVLQGQSRPGAGWGNSPAEQAARRSIYVHVKRSLLVPILEMHDQADTDSSCPVRYVTTVPTQSLGMLNGEFTNARAKRLAERLEREAPGDRAQQVRIAIRLTSGRTPPLREVEEDLQLMASLKQEHQMGDIEALQAYCLLVLNTNEFAYLD